MSQLPPATIPEALLANAGRGEGAYAFHLDEGEAWLSCEALAERASLGARRLIGLGVEPGDAVGILGPNRPEWVVWAFSVWMAGAAVVPIQIPVRIKDPDAFAAQIASIVEAGGCTRVIADPRMVGLLTADVAVPWDASGEVSGEQPAGPSAESAAVIQFTSGSTSAPKGARLTHAAVLAQMDIMRHGYCRSDGTPRSILSWTPLFHDLGLFSSVVLPSVWGAQVHHLPTERFARDPVEWLRLVERTRAALTVGPSSAFGSALRATHGRDERPDLGSLEVACFAAEGVDPRVAQRMTDSARTLGLRPSSLASSYGLAEAVLGVAYSVAESGIRIDRVDLDALASAGFAAPAGEGPAKVVISSGPPRTELRIVGPDGDLPERQVGEILVGGDSLMSGYVGTDVPDPFVDGWLRTGDMGYLADGELYVTGRAKDLIIALGQNYYPEDFEWAAARVDAVRPGRCVAFTKPDSEEVVLLVEPRDGQPERAVRRDVRRAVADAVGVAPGEIVVLPSGTVEKTTSGKLRRSAMRDAYLEGRLPGAVAD